MVELKRAMKAAFPHTIPILTGFIFLGFAFGILMQVQGFHIGWTMLLSIITFAGSMQFLAVSLLSMDFQPLYIIGITLMVNARHLFYGISMLQTFQNTKKYKPFLIFSLCDETFSVLCFAKAPIGIDRTKFMFSIAFLNYLYWVVGSFLGGFLGQYIRFDTTGLDFVLTALFVVIFINQWKSLQHHYAPLIGLGCTMLSLLLFGRDHCILMAMLMILLSLTYLQKKKSLEEML